MHHSTTAHAAMLLSWIVEFFALIDDNPALYLRQAARMAELYAEYRAGSVRSG